MDVERGARRRQDGEEWVERLERHLVQLSSGSTIAPKSTKLGMRMGLNFDSTQFNSKRQSMRSRNHVNMFANIHHLLQLSNKIDETMRVAINRKHKHPLLLLK